MAKVLILADPATADVFSLTDLEVRTVRSGGPGARLLREALDDGFEIIFVAEGLADGLKEEIRGAQRGGEAIIAVIPGVGAGGGLGKELLSELRSNVIRT